KFQVEFRVFGRDKAGSFGRLGRSGPRSRCKLHTEWNSLAESGHHPRAGDLPRLAQDRWGQSDANSCTVMSETDCGGVGESSGLITPMVPSSKLPISPMPRAGHPRTEVGHQPDDNVNRKNDQTEDQEFHGIDRCSGVTGAAGPQGDSDDGAKCERVA